MPEGEKKEKLIRCVTSSLETACPPAYKFPTSGRARMGIKTPFGSNVASFSFGVGVFFDARAPVQMSNKRNGPFRLTAVCVCVCVGWNTPTLWRHSTTGAAEHSIGRTRPAMCLWIANEKTNQFIRRAKRGALVSWFPFFSSLFPPSSCKEQKEAVVCVCTACNCRSGEIWVAE